MSYCNNQQGVTLLEAVLALLIISTLIVLGFKQSQVFQRDNQVRQIVANVDQLFQALAAYYQTNCRVAASFPQPPNSTPITISIASLITTGLLSEWKPIINSVVDSSVGEDGYALAFNGSSLSTTHTPTNIFYNWTSSATVPITVQFTNSVGLVYVWTSHIAVKLKKDLNGTVYRGKTGATCTSETDTTCDLATACTKNSTTCYLIWESLPSFASRSTLSPYSPALARGRAFTNLYYTDDMYSASNPNWGTTGPTPNNLYLCGG